MNNENVIIVTDQKTIESLIENAIKKANNEKEQGLSEFEKDRISKTQAAKLAGVSLPTLEKLVRLNKFIQHNVGHRKYFLKSEMIQSLRNQTI